MNKTFSRLSLLVLFCLLIGQNGVAQEPSGYYKSAEGLKQKALLQQLCTIISSHTNVGYDGLWNVYKDSDVRTGTNYYWDMYSTANYRVGQSKCGNYSNVGDCVNREHSFPKSWFNEANPMKADAFHVYPTDGKVNGQRSNYPYGECDGGTTLASHNGVDALGKLGKCTFPGYSGTVFEPVDEYKGDFARTYFYMAACYNDKISSWSSPMLSGNNYPCYTTWAVNLLLKWNEQDPVSQKEIDRNNAVYNHQHNRNPFIDHPELAEYIWGDRQTVGWTPGGVVDPKITAPYNGSTIDFGVTSINKSITKTISVQATGLTENLVATINGEGFVANVAYITPENANSGTTFRVTYTSSAATTSTATLTLSSSEVSTSVTLKAMAVDGIPALEATAITSNGFTARWTDIDNDGSNYSLYLYNEDGTTAVSGYPVSVKAADGQYAVTGLAPLSTYKYQLVNASQLKSNVVTVQTTDVDRTITLDTDGEIVLTAAPGTPSTPAAITLYSENINESVINLETESPFEISFDKTSWSTALEASTAETLDGLTFYIRLSAQSEGTYSAQLSASTTTVEGAEISVSALVSTPITFFEDFEPAGNAPYSTFDYQGSACKWHINNAGIASRSGDKFHGKSGVCTAKSGTRYIEMSENKNDGAGEVTLYAAPYGSDADAEFELQYSVDNGSTWKVAKSFVVSDKSELEQCKATLNIAQPVRLRIEQASGVRLNIDDISITSYSAGVDSVIVGSNWDAYVSGGMLRLQSSVPAVVSIYGIDGREVSTISFSGETSQSLPAGCYIVVNGNDSRKVVIR